MLYSLDKVRVKKKKHIDWLVQTYIWKHLLSRVISAELSYSYGNWVLMF